MNPRSAPSARRGTRRVALVAALLVTGALVACEPDPPAPVSVGSVAADRDTFAVSHQPDARRGDDVVLRVMTTSEKTKIGYLSFPVAADAPLDATLTVVPRQSGFAVDVRGTGRFTEAVTYNDRPALGAIVGRLPRTQEGVVQQIALNDVPVVDGRVDLALTTSGPYELEVVSSEGAAAADAPGTAPHLVVGAASESPTTSTPTTAPPTTSPPTTSPPTTTTASGSSGWELTFSDEFDGTAVDTQKWLVYDEQGSWNAVESPKTTTCPKASNVTVSGGILRMRTQKANGSCAGGQAQSGAGLNTWGRFTQAGGRFEVRGRWTQAGNYLWGGFWTAELGKGGADPSEIDTWEYIGKDAEPNLHRFKPAIHYNYTCEGTCGTQAVPHTDYDVTQWHTYVVEWEPRVPGDDSTVEIRFLLDGQMIALFDRDGAWLVTSSGAKVQQIAGGWANAARAFPNPFGLDRRHHLILSAWVGAPGASAATVDAGYRPAGGHADLEIDYVRVYSR